MKGKLVACVAVALLAACTLGPNYARPKLAVPAQHRGQSAAPAGPSAVPLGELDWWKLYRDPALHTLLRTALRTTTTTCASRSSASSRRVPCSAT